MIIIVLLSRLHLWDDKNPESGNEMKPRAQEWISSVLLCSIGYLLGGHVMRLFHGHDEVVTIPGSDQSEEQQRYETLQAPHKRDYTAEFGLT